MCLEKLQCAAILAGGKSSRMQREKALIEVDGETLIARTSAVLRPLFSQIVVVTSNVEVASAADLPAISDQYPECGPLGGIHSALKHFRQSTFVVACDMPFLNSEFIRDMARSFSQRPLVPQHERGIEPLHAIYTVEQLSLFEGLLERGGKLPSFKKIFVEVEADYLLVPNSDYFENWNSPDDVRES